MNAHTSSKETILIVDDKPQNLGVITDFLKEQGFRISSALNGETALERAMTIKPDLILLDINMPGMDGFTTCEKLASEENTKHIPVIFMTALTSTEDKVKGFQVGAVDYITKPIQKEELIARVTTHLRLHHYQESLEKQVAQRTRELQHTNDKLLHEIREKIDAEQEKANLQDYLKNVISNMPSALIGTSNEGFVTIWNKEAENQTGITPSKALGKRLADVYTFLELPQEKIGSAISNNSVISIERVEKERQFYNITIYPLQENGAIIRVDDITSFCEMETRLRHSEKLQAIGELAGGVAHDFNNQLNGILGNAELLMIDPLFPTELQEYLDSIVTSVGRSSDLTKQLLAFARKGKQHSRTINIHSLIDETVSLLERSIDKKIVIEKQLFCTLPNTEGDPGQLQNALLNLGINARDAIDGTGTITFKSDTISISSKVPHSIWNDVAPGNYIMISISDTGTGIPQQMLDRVFEPFFTTKDEGKGTGMGLAAVFGTVKSHNGSIKVKSVEQAGTIFTLLLPISDKEFHEEKKTISIDKKHLNRNALVIDDDEHNLKLMERFLQKSGFSVKLAQNGDEGVREFKEHWRNIDIVILDMMMPVMNGETAFKLMKEINPHVKVIMQSGNAPDKTAQNLIDLGLKSYIQKPFRLHKIYDIIENVIGC